jgi:hypothetical protein
MSGDETALEPWVERRQRAELNEGGDSGPGGEGLDLTNAARWLERHGLVLVGVLLVAASLVLKAHFLSGLYFRQDDFHLLDRALVNPLDWSQLTFIGAGHLIPGPYLFAWLMTRAALYNWGLASAISLVFVGAADLAALGLLRALFGDRPGILIPLVFYLLCPLTMPDLGIWSSALESVPLQLAVFSAVHAQLRYVRTDRTRDLVAAVFWVAFGLFFFEKGLVLPLLLFALTSGFFMGPGSWLANARRCAVRYWRAWLVYVVLLAGYSAVLKVALKTSVSQPGLPGSAGRAWTFVSALVTKTLIPGIVGGPWHWFPTTDKSYAVAAAPGPLVWIAWILVVLVVGASILRSPVAWRAWATFCLWVVCADMIPVLIGRVGDYSPTVLGLESRYVADSIPVLAICLGLAFWPVVSASPSGQPEGSQASAGQRSGMIGKQARSPGAQQAARTAVALATGAFLASSLWSIQAYQDSTSGDGARTYITNATLAVNEAPKGTVVVDHVVPPFIAIGAFGPWAKTSTVVGDIARGEPASHLRWVSVPNGTFGTLMMFGMDGRLHDTQVAGVGSRPRLAGRNCYAASSGRIVVPFLAAAPSGTKILRIGYFWDSQYPETATVRYGTEVKAVTFEPGLHGLYLPVRGSALRVVISGYGLSRPCIGDAEAGVLEPATTGPTIPATFP